jgi:hypothetical protein
VLPPLLFLEEIVAGALWLGPHPQPFKIFARAILDGDAPIYTFCVAGMTGITPMLICFLVEMSST